MANVTRVYIRQSQENSTNEGKAITKKRRAVPVSRRGLELIENRSIESTNVTSKLYRKPWNQNKIEKVKSLTTDHDNIKKAVQLSHIQNMETDVQKSSKADSMEIEELRSEIKEIFKLSSTTEVEDIDKDDFDNPQLCSEFVNDIYQYMLHLESEYPIKKNYLKETSLKPRMRTILVDWLFQVHRRFGLLQETIFLTVTILDRFLQTEPVARTELQLAGVTAMLIASKYEEMYAPEVNDFVYITDQAFTRSQILHMEILMLKTLNFSLGKPLHLHFLRRNSKAGQVNADQHTLAKYLMELSLLDYDMCHIPPSKVAASALCLSIKLLGSIGWTETLEHYSTYSFDSLLPVVCHLSKNLKAAETSTYLEAVKTKYASSKTFKISTCDALKSHVVEELANKAASTLL